MDKNLTNSSPRSREKRQNENVNGNNHNRDRPQDHWGHKLGKKHKHTTRVCFVNINGLGKKQKSPKSEEIRTFMTQNKIDVMGMAEININWARVANKDTLWERTRHWFEHRIISVGYNTHDRNNKTSQQQGGTTTILKDKIAHRHRNCGFVRTGLGRWFWVQIAGKQGYVTRFITVYCPVYTGKGDNTVYSQHLRELNQDPTQRFWTDLGTEILHWKAPGEQIIISGDWNEKITSVNIQTWMSLFGLKELITSIHDGDPPYIPERKRCH